MSEELKATANNGTEAQKPAAPAAAAKPAAARPAGTSCRCSCQTCSE